MIKGWSFRSTHRADAAPGSLDRFWIRIEEALRVAPRGVGVLRWTMETGPRGRAVVGCESPELIDWIGAVLLPCYPPGSWVEVASVPSPDIRGWRLRAVPTMVGPFWAASDGRPPWIESVLATLPLLPRGLSLALELEPLGPPSNPTLRGEDGPLVPQPPGFRAPAPTRAARSSADLLAERRRGARWCVRGGLAFSDGTPSGRTAAVRLANLVEVASRRGGGSGFQLRPRRPWLGRAGDGVLLVTAELAMLLPGPECRFLPFGRDHAPGAIPLVAGLGVTGRPAHFWIDPEEGRHLAVIGETGMGKSTLLLQLARQAHRGAAVVLFDPIGDTARRYLSSLGPAALARTLWVSPRDSPVAVNALASLTCSGVAGNGQRDRTLDDLVGALRRVRESRYSDSPFWGPRIEETVRRAIAAASALPNGTLVEAERLLSSPTRAWRGIPPEAQPLVDALRARVLERPEEVDGARRLLGEIAGNEVLRRMLCHPAARSTVVDWVGEGRITVISGDAGSVGEAAARGLLSVHLALVWSAIQARANASKVFVILDEAQWYAHEAAAEILRLGRRQNVHLWVATQALASLTDPVAEAIRTNCADFVIFRGSPEEARTFHRWLPSISEESLLSLGAGEAVVLSGKGEDVQWARIARAPPRDVDSAALQLARDGSRDRCPAGEPWNAGGPDPSADLEGDPAPVESTARRVRELLLVLWAGFLEAEPSQELRLGLRELRMAFDPAGEAIRIVGGRLAQAGALVHLEDGSEGRGWKLLREPFRSTLPDDLAPGELSQAIERWGKSALRKGGSG